MRASHCAQLLHTILDRTDLNRPSYHADNHHCSSDVYLREGGAHSRHSPYTLQGDLDPHLIHDSMGPPESTLQTASRILDWLSRFYIAHAESAYTLQWAAPFRFKVAPSHDWLSS